MTVRKMARLVPWLFLPAAVIAGLADASAGVRFVCAGVQNS